VIDQGGRIILDRDLLRPEYIRGSFNYLQVLKQGIRNTLPLSLIERPVPLRPMSLIHTGFYYDEYSG
jgi:hypothetical protein